MHLFDLFYLIYFTYIFTETEPFSSEPDIKATADEAGMDKIAKPVPLEEDGIVLRVRGEILQ